MELTVDIIFLSLSSASNDFIDLFIVIDVGCEIKYIRTTESTNISYVSIQLICATATTIYHKKDFPKN